MYHSAKNIAQGSLEECRYYLILAKGLGYIDTKNLESRLGEVSKFLEAYSNAILDSGSWLLSKGILMILGEL